MATVTAGAAGVDMDQLSLGDLLGASIAGATASGFSLVKGALTFRIAGAGFTFGSTVTAGTIQAIDAVVSGVTVYSLSGLNVAATTFMDWVSAADTATAKLTMLSGGDAITGSDQADVLRGYLGSDTITGGAGGDYLDGGDGDDSALGGLGDDTVVDSSGSNYLRGNEGSDSIIGGAGFDDVHGNMGEDTEYGGPGDDWVVGGQGNDLLFGDGGGDIVYGNLGDDTCNGGEGDDLVRGGQGNDVIDGGLGDDWLSGDRGDDTITGGAGADIFHSFGDAGVDRVLDFSVAQGDRVQLDPGSFYNVQQVGADTVISISGGAQLILVGVSMSTLTPASIFLA